MINHRVGACLALIVLLLGSSPHAKGQENVPTPGPVSSFEAIEINLPSTDVIVSITRIELEEGVTLPLDTSPGPTLVAVAEGELAFDSSQTQLLTSDTPNGTAVSTPPASPGTAEAGGMLLVAADSDVTLSTGRSQSAVIVIIRFGTTAGEDVASSESSVTMLVSDVIHFDSTRVRVEIQRLMLAQWATTEEMSIGQGATVIVESGALALELEGGMAQIGRAYGGQETLVATREEESPGAEPDPEADPQAGSETGDGQPPVPPLSGTVAGLGAGDVVVANGTGAIELQGVSEAPASVVLISFTPMDER